MANRYRNWRNYLRMVNRSIKDGGWKMKVVKRDDMTAAMGHAIYACEVWKDGGIVASSMIARTGGRNPFAWLTENNLIGKIEDMWHNLEKGYYNY